MLDLPSNMRSAAFVGADYTEYQPQTMKGFYVTYGDGVIEPERFPTIEEALAFAFMRAEKVFCLSSVDHYASDARRFQ